MFSCIEKQVREVFDYEDSIIFLKACAGAGKTTALLNMAKEIEEKRPNEKILYLVFNRKNRIEAKRKFPLNTRVHTIHSCAKMITNRKYGDFFEVINVYKKIIGGFLSSQEDIASILHKIEYKLIKRFPLETFEESIVSLMEDGKLPVLFNIGVHIALNTESDFFEVFDYIFVDEAQDLNPLYINYIMKFRGKKVFVGDDFQHIYSFNYSCSVFDYLKKNDKNIVEKKLLKTYRFGKEYAQWLNKTITNLGFKHLQVQGNDNIETKIVSTEEMDRMVVEKKGRYAYISRTNMFIWDTVIKNLDFYEEKNVRIYIPFNIEKIKEFILKIYFFNKGLKEAQYELMTYSNEFLENKEDFDRISAINPDFYIAYKLYKLYDIDILKILERIKNLYGSPKEKKKNSSIKSADIIFITAHKSKGFDYSNIRLADDYNIIKQKSKGKIKEEEINVLYVALTRVKNQISFDKKLKEFLL